MRRQLGGLIAAQLPDVPLAATTGDLPCVTGLPTDRRWRATAQRVPRPWPRRTRTRTTVRHTRTRLRAAELRHERGRTRRGHRAHGFRSQLTAAAAAVRPNAEARSQVRPDTRAASGSTGASAGSAGTDSGRSTRSLRGPPTRRHRSCDGRAGARSRTPAVLHDLAGIGNT